MCTHPSHNRLQVAQRNATPRNRHANTLTADVVLADVLPTVYDNTTWNVVDDCNDRPLRGFTPTIVAAPAPHPVVAVTTKPRSMMDTSSTPPDEMDVYSELVITASSPSVMDALNAATVKLLPAVTHTDNDVSNVLPTATANHKRQAHMPAIDQSTRPSAPLHTGQCTAGYRYS